MAQRIIKNYTASSHTLTDIGSIIVPANGAVDVGGDSRRMIQLASSSDLMALLGQGIANFQVNDGNQDYDFLAGIDLILQISLPTCVDSTGKAIVRTDSRRQDYDIMFTGAGDDATLGIGNGTVLRWDFSNEQNVTTLPNGFKQQSIEFSFIDTTYIKDGMIYFFSAPKESYLDFYFNCPKNYPYMPKTVDPATADVVWGELKFATQDTVIGHWANHLLMEGDCPMGNEMATEATADIPTPPYITFTCTVSVPPVFGWENFHGHINLQVYRGRTVIL